MLDLFGLSSLAWPLAALGGLLLAAVPRLRPGLVHPGMPLIATAIAVLTCTACIIVSAPVGDDWTYALAGREGWLATQASTWQTWSGRFTATALLSAWPNILPLHGGYPLVAAISAAVALGGWCALTWHLLPSTLPTGQRCGLVALVVLGLLAGLPSLAEGGAWLAGSLTYTLPTGCAAWAWVLLLRYRYRWSGPVALLAVAAAAGGNELTAAANAGLLPLAAVALRRRSDPRWRWMAAAAAVATLGLVLSYTAPGNVLRRDLVLEDRLPPTLAQVLVSALRAGGEVLLAGLASAGLCAAAIVALATRSPGPRPPLWLAGLLLGGAFLIAAGLQVPSIAATDWACPPRAANLVWLAAWSSVAAGGICLGLRLGPHLAISGPATLPLHALPPAAVLLAFLGTGGLGRAASDLPLLPAHANALAERHRLLTTALPGSDLDLPLFDPDRTPRSCLAYDLTPWRGDWSNRACAAWHHLASVRIIVPDHLRPGRPHAH